MHPYTADDYKQFQYDVHAGRPEDVDAFYAQHFTGDMINVVNGTPRPLDDQKALVRSDREAGRLAYPARVPWLVQDGVWVSARSYGTFKGNWEARGFVPGTILIQHMQLFDDRGLRRAFVHLARPLPAGEAEFSDPPHKLVETPVPRRFDRTSYQEWRQSTLDPAKGLDAFCAEDFQMHVDGQTRDLASTKAYWLSLAQATGRIEIEVVDVVVQQGNRLSARVFFRALDREGRLQSRTEIIEDLLFDAQTGKLALLVQVSRSVPHDEKTWLLKDLE